MTLNVFSTSYAEAREKFLIAANASGAIVSSYEHPELGPGNETLFADCAWIGPVDATKVLVLSSGTHGVEGFCGSGAQIDWLHRHEYSFLEDDMAVLLIHAINPYGFAWKRRVTHENVDLNRNFVDFASPLPLNPYYGQLAHVLAPHHWDDDTKTSTRAEILSFAREHGFPALAQTVSGGQYTHQDGLFFGGFGPTWSRITLENIFNEHLSRASHIGIVDYHTGLGPEGYAEPIITTDPDTPETARAIQWHGQAAKVVGSGESASAEIAGDWLWAAPRLLPHAQVTGISLEYGTVDSAVVLEALRADNWLHNYGDPRSDVAIPIKQQILDAFYVDSDIWRGMVLGQSVMTVRQAIYGLARSSKNGQL
jgi:hypothetical protein